MTSRKKNCHAKNEVVLQIPSASYRMRKYVFFPKNNLDKACLEKTAIVEWAINTLTWVAVGAGVVLVCPRMRL